MKKHPGVWFTLWSLEVLFLLSFELQTLGTPVWLKNSILFFLGMLCTFWITIFHVKWIERNTK